MTKADKIEILALLILLPIIGLMLIDALGRGQHYAPSLDQLRPVP